MPDSDAIRNIFARVHRSYRLVNTLLTFGLDRLWRRRAAAVAAEAGEGRWLDLCSGTGDMAANLKERAPGKKEIYALDFTIPMVKTALGYPETGDIRFIAGDVRKLPFPDNTFDLLTISFSTRNINLSRKVLTDTFREFLRVLKPGGMFVNLETSQPPSPFIRWLYHVMVRLYVAPTGRIISGYGPAYRYLSRTITSFYPPRELASIMTEAGFRDVTFRRMTLGAVAIHRAFKSGRIEPD